MPDTAPVTAPATATNGESPPAGVAAPAEQPGNTLPGDDAIIQALEKGTPVSATEAAADKDKTKEDPKKPADKPKESAVMRSVQKREQDLIRDRAALNAEKAGLTAQIEQRIQIGITDALKKQFADPRTAVKTLTGLGLLPQQIAEALVKPDAPSAEELARQAIKEATDLKARLEKEAKTARDQTSEKEFVEAIRVFKDEFKELHTEWTEPEIISEAYKLAAELQAECSASGRPFPTNISNKSVLKVLNARAKAKLDRRAELTRPKEDPRPAVDPKKNGTSASTVTLGKNMGERQSIVTTDPVLMSNDDIIKQVEKQLAEGINIKPR